MGTALDEHVGVDHWIRLYSACIVLGQVCEYILLSKRSNIIF